MALQKQVKTKIYLGIISIVVVFATSAITYYFSKPKTTESQRKTNIKSDIKLSDSASINDNSNKVLQVNTNNKAPVNNDFSRGKKEVKITKTEKLADTVINNGNLSVNQKGGTVNQTTVIGNMPRKFSDVDLAKLKTISSTDSIDIVVCQAKQEALDYASEIYNYLLDNNFPVRVFKYNISNDAEYAKNRFSIIPQHSGLTEVLITCQ